MFFNNVGDKRQRLHSTQKDTYRQIHLLVARFLKKTNHGRKKGKDKLITSVSSELHPCSGRSAEEKLK